MSKIKIAVPMHRVELTSGDARTMTVSLPAPPFDLPPVDRSETAPRCPPIRAGLGIPREDRLLRQLARQAAHG